MDDLSRYKIRAKIAIGVVSVIAAAVYLLFARAIQPSDELAARFLRYVLDGGGKVYRPDGTVREITREAIDKISVTDCRVWNRKAEVHICDVAAIAGAMLSSRPAALTQSRTGPADGRAATFRP